MPLQTLEIDLSGSIDVESTTFRRALKEATQALIKNRQLKVYNIFFNDIPITSELPCQTWSDTWEKFGIWVYNGIIHPILRKVVKFIMCSDVLDEGKDLLYLARIYYSQQWFRTLVLQQTLHISSWQRQAMLQCCMMSIKQNIKIKKPLAENKQVMKEYYSNILYTMSMQDCRPMKWKYHKHILQYSVLWDIYENDKAKYYNYGKCFKYAPSFLFV